MTNLTKNLQRQGDKTGGFTSKVTTIVTNTSSYSIDDNIGGAVKIKDILRNQNETGVISDICLWATANGKFTAFLDFWSDQPLGIIDGASMDISNAANANIWLGCAEVDSADWQTTSSIDRIHVSNVNILVISKQISDSTQAIKDLWVTIQTKEAVTLNSLIIKVGILQD